MSSPPQAVLATPGIWDAVGSVGTGLALVAFIVATAATALKWSLARQRHLIESAQDDRRAELVRNALEVYHIDAARLSSERQYDLAMAQIRERARRFRTSAVVAVILAVLLSLLSAYAIHRSNPDLASSETGPNLIAAGTKTQPVQLYVAPKSGSPIGPAKAPRPASRDSVADPSAELTIVQSPEDGHVQPVQRMVEGTATLEAARTESLEASQDSAPRGKTSTPSPSVEKKTSPAVPKPPPVNSGAEGGANMLAVEAKQAPTKKQSCSNGECSSDCPCGAGHVCDRGRCSVCSPLPPHVGGPWPKRTTVRSGLGDVFTVDLDKRKIDVYLHGSSGDSSCYVLHYQTDYGDGFGGFGGYSVRVDGLNLIWFRDSDGFALPVMVGKLCKIGKHQVVLWRERHRHDRDFRCSTRSFWKRP